MKYLTPSLETNVYWPFFGYVFLSTVWTSDSTPLVEPPHFLGVLLQQLSPGYWTMVVSSGMGRVSTPLYIPFHRRGPSSELCGNSAVIIYLSWSHPSGTRRSSQKDNSQLDLPNIQENSEWVVRCLLVADVYSYQHHLRFVLEALMHSGYLFGMQCTDVPHPSSLYPVSNLDQFHCTC